MVGDSTLPVSFDEREVKVIVNGFIRFVALREERLAAKKEAANQEKAVNFIANMVGIKPATTGCSDDAWDEDGDLCLAPTKNRKEDSHG